MQFYRLARTAPICCITFRTKPSINRHWNEMLLLWWLYSAVLKCYQQRAISRSARANHKRKPDRNRFGMCRWRNANNFFRNCVRSSIIYSFRLSRTFLRRSGKCLTLITSTHVASTGARKRFLKKNFFVVFLFHNDLNRHFLEELFLFRRLLLKYSYSLHIWRFSPFRYSHIYCWNFAVFFSAHDSVTRKNSRLTGEAPDCLALSLSYMRCFLSFS